MTDNLKKESLPCGVLSYLYVSAMTSLFLPPKNGSRKIVHGLINTSELEPSAWPVLEPSKFHHGNSLGCLGSKSTVIVLERQFSPVPSIHTYVTSTLSSGCGKSRNFFRTAFSVADGFKFIGFVVIIKLFDSKRVKEKEY
jgi:hypothetical protein